MFIHYSTANIHDMTLLEALKSPLFMKYYESQPFNGNHLRPCPMLENPYELGRMVSESGAHGTDLFNGNHLRPCPMLENPYELGRMVSESGAHGTDLVEPESPEDLRRKTVPAAAAWAPVADRLWKDESDPLHRKREEDPPPGMAETDIARLAHLSHIDGRPVEAPPPRWAQGPRRRSRRRPGPAFFAVEGRVRPHAPQARGGSSPGHGRDRHREARAPEPHRLTPG